MIAPETSYPMPCIHPMPVKNGNRIKSDLLYGNQKVLVKWQNCMLLNDKTYFEALFKNLSLFIIKVQDCLHTKRQTVNIGNFH